MLRIGVSLTQLFKPSDNVLVHAGPLGGSVMVLLAFVMRSCSRGFLRDRGSVIST
jgi:hypothetical protein